MYEIEAQGHANLLDDRDEPWTVFFYSPKCTKKECRAAAKAYRAAAKVWGGFIKVSAVNCFREAGLCERFGQSLSSKTEPVLLWLGMQKGDEGTKYEGEVEAKAIQSWMNQQMPKDGVTEVRKVVELRAWVDKATAKNKPAIVLFTDKREVVFVGAKDRL